MCTWVYAGLGGQALVPTKLPTRAAAAVLTFLQALASLTTPHSRLMPPIPAVPASQVFSNAPLPLPHSLCRPASLARDGQCINTVYQPRTNVPCRPSLLPAPQVFMEKDATWVFFIEWIPAFALYR